LRVPFSNDSLELIQSAVGDVERSAGITLFSDAFKSSSRHICQATKCQVMVRRFDDAQKRPKLRRAISTPE
jgi:endonuclease G